MAKLGVEFFRRDAATVAREMIGMVLVRRRGDREARVRLVETEAYVGPHDLACHASKGCTPRTEVMFRPGGIWYVYLIYGMYEMLNVVTGGGGADGGQAVLIRGAQGMTGLKEGVDLTGPGKLTRFLEIGRDFNGKSVFEGEMWLERGEAMDVVVTKRIGVDYAKEWAAKPLRFVAKGAPVAGRKRGR